MKTTKRKVCLVVSALMILCTSSITYAASTPTVKAKSVVNITYSNMSILSYGSKGTAIKQLQLALNSWNSTHHKFSALICDGIFGSDTKTAVKIFQSANGLSADGVVGPKTWKVMLNFSTQSQSQKTK